MKINKLTDYSIVLLSHFVPTGLDGKFAAAKARKHGGLGRSAALGVAPRSDQKLKSSAQQKISPLKTARQLAQETRIPYPTVVKILKNLTRKKLLKSERGVHGGYYLARPAQKISIAQVIEASEGPLAITECIAATKLCLVASKCPTQSNWNKINRLIAGTLDNLDLTTIVPQGKERSLSKQAKKANTQ